MKMRKIQKLLVNSKLRDKWNLRRAIRLFEAIDLSNTTEVLEIGCGDGMVSAHLAAKYKMNIVGIDVDPEQIELAKKYFEGNENLKFFEADAAELPFDNNRFDMVLALNVFHHLEDRFKTLEEINRVLRTNGFFVFTGFAYSRFAAKILRCINMNFNVYTMNGITRFLGRNNLKIVYKERPIHGFRKNYCRVIYQKFA